MEDDGDIVQMELGGNSSFGLTDCSSENNDSFNGIDISAIPINSLITSNEWQMRMYGYKKAINEIDSVHICEFENQFIKSIINDKNISSQNLGIRFMSIYIDNFGMKIDNLPAIWKDNISEMLINKTLFNQKTSISSINLAFSFFEQSLLLENGDLTKVDYLWDNMIDFINNNRKSKGIAIKQIFGIVRLFSSFIDNYGIELSPIVKWSKALLPLVSECSDKNTKGYIYEILSMVNQESSLMELISSSLTTLQLKEVSKRSVELDEKKKREPIRNIFVDKIKSRLNSNRIDSSLVVKDYGNSIDAFDLIEPVDVTKMLPSNWLEIISDKEVKWSERKVIIDQFCRLCEAHKKLSINQNENKITSQNIKKSFAPTITDYQNLLNILQRIIKCEGNTALILSVIRLCSNLVNCLRGKISTIIRPLTTQIMIKIKDQNKIVCTESTHFINIVLKFSLSLDQIFDDLCQYGFKEKVTTAKCSAITICNYLIDEIIEMKNPLEKHLKGIKQLVNVIPSCFDDPSVQVRSSASILLVKLKNPCFGEDINSILQKIIMGLNNNKQKLINETEKKLGIHVNTNSENVANGKHIGSKTLPLFVKTTKPPPNSTLATPNNESAQLNRKSLSKIGLCKQLEIPNNDSTDVGNYLSKSNIRSMSSTRSIENSTKTVNENYIHNSENFPTILGSISSKNDQKINFFQRLSNKPVKFQTIENTGEKNVYYIDPTDSRNFIIELPGAEIIFETHESGLSCLQDYIKPFVSDNLFTSMFSNNKIQIDFSITFWERFCNFLSESGHHKFTLFFFFFKWISYNIEMRIAANYERIIVALMNMFLSQDEQYKHKYNESIIYNIFLVVVNIIVNELQMFDKSSMLSNYEISKYEKIIFLIMDKGSKSTTYLKREGEQTLNKSNNTLFLMNTVIISTLDDLGNFDNKINLINNNLNMMNDSPNFLKNYGVSNIHSLIKFIEHSSSSIKDCDSINKILSRISNNIGISLWNSILFYFPDVHVEKYCISNDSGSLNNSLQYKLVIINSLEYETIQLFNIIGSTGNPKDIGILLYSDVYPILRKIVANLYIISNKLKYVLENNEIEKTFMDNNIISSLLIEHIAYFSEISIHIYFTLTKLESFKHLEVNEIIKTGQIGELFFKTIEYLDMFTCKFQTIMTKKEFPIKEIMINTLFIMSDYLFWKEHINDEIQKVKIVNSLNNIMGINIILSFQKELPKLMKIIIEVVLFGIKQNNQTIFDIDLLNRLLPKVLRRMKVYLSKNSIDEFQIESINHCFELINPLIDEGSNQLIIIIDFTLDYLLLLLESGLNIQKNEQCRFLSKVLEKLNKDNFQCKIERIKTLMQ